MAALLLCVRHDVHHVPRGPNPVKMLQLQCRRDVPLKLLEGKRRIGVHPGLAYCVIYAADRALD